MRVLRQSTPKSLLTGAVVVAALVVPPGLAVPAQAAPEIPAQTAVATRRLAPASAAEVDQIHAVRMRVIATAMSRIGSTYQWGAAGPTEFDCSGLVLWTYLTATGVSLPHYSGAQMQVTKPVARTRLRKGDLLFYGTNGSQHVTMYLGRRQQIGASNSRDGIVIDSIDSPYWVANYAGAGRIVRLGALRRGLFS